MREIRIDQTIVNMRKKRGITQEELAKAVGVSKASVSKWETGGSFPDISMLPRLASYFQISIDQLMAYSPQMTEEEIRETFAGLEERFSGKDGEMALEECQELARNYSACFPLLLRLVLFYVNCLPAVEEKTRKEMLTAALELCLRIRNECGDVAIRKQAAGLEGACLLLRGRPEKALELLGDGGAVLSGEEGLIALAYENMGDRQRAGKVLQVGIYQHMMAVVENLTAYLHLNGDNAAVFEETWGRLQRMFEIFHLETLRPAAVLQAYMTAAGALGRNGEEERAMEILERYLELYRGGGYEREPGGDEFFDQVGSWMEETPLGSDLMRKQREVQRNAVKGMLKEPDFDCLRDHPGFRKILRQLEEGKEKEKAEKERKG